MSDGKEDVKIIDAVDQDGRTYADRVRLGLVSEGPACENCGHVFEDGDEVQSQATGTWGEWGAELGDSYVMCLECPDEPEPAPEEATA